MKVTFWGTRGSIAAAGADTHVYGGNTACAQVVAADGTCLVLDAGTGLRALGLAMPTGVSRIDILLTHLHMDHIQGLGFFGPLFQPDLEVHIWGPPSATMDLRTRLSRYFSPPLFPLQLRDLTARLELHDAPDVPIRIGGFQVSSKTVIHPGPTVGYRIEEGGSSMAYIPDHEPALGASDFPDRPMWTSGHDLAADVDLLVHDAQYFPDERAERIGWGHASTTEVARFAQQARVRQLACFHHDPAHDDAAVDRLVEEVAAAASGIEVIGAREGATIEL